MYLQAATYIYSLLTIRFAFLPTGTLFQTESNITEPNVTDGVANSTDEINQDANIWDGVSEWFEATFFAPIYDMVGGIIRAVSGGIFSIPVIDTAGGGPFGAPVGGASAPERAIDVFGGILSWIAGEGFNCAWPVASDSCLGVAPGGISVFIGLTLVIAGLGLNGLADMIKFKQPKNSDRNLLVGFGMMLFWFPFTVLLVNLVHGSILSFVSDSFLTQFVSGLVGILGAGVIAGVATGAGIIAYIILAVILVVPYLLIAVGMALRAIILGLYMIFGPVLIGLGYAGIPTISDGSIWILKKFIPIAAFPIGMTPILFMVEHFMWSDGLMSAMIPPFGFSIGNMILVTAVGWVLLFALWIVFGMMAPQVAGVINGAVKFGFFMGSLATGSGGFGFSALRHGPGTAVLRSVAKSQGAKGGGLGVLGKVGKLDSLESVMSSNGGEGLSGLNSAMSWGRNGGGRRQQEERADANRSNQSMEASSGGRGTQQFGWDDEEGGSGGSNGEFEDSGGSSWRSQEGRWSDHEPSSEQDQDESTTTGSDFHQHERYHQSGYEFTQVGWDNSGVILGNGGDGGKVPLLNKTKVQQMAEELSSQTDSYTELLDTAESRISTELDEKHLVELPSETQKKLAYNAKYAVLEESDMNRKGENSDESKEHVYYDQGDGTEFIR